MHCLFPNEGEGVRSQQSLDKLSDQKWTWKEFLEKTEDLLSISRLHTTKEGRCLLHLAVLDNRLDVVSALKHDPSLSLKRDNLGLSPIEFAKFLDRKECLKLLMKEGEKEVIPSLPAVPNFTYLSHPVFENKEAFEKILRQVERAKKEDKIPAEKIWMGIYFDKEVCNGVHPPISIRFVDSEIGYGVFAEKKIPACTFVGEYVGLIQEKKPKQLQKKQYCLRYTIWGGKKNFTLDAENTGNFTRFINHSEKPNLCLQSIYWRGIPRMIFVTMREVREGAQLTFDYGPLFWKESSQTQKFIDDF